MSAKVFISYSHQDLDRNWIQAFASALQDQDVDVWLDDWDIKPGDRIADAIETGLLESEAIIAIIPSSAIKRPSLYFELGVAFGANKRLILVVDPSAANAIPFDLRQRRWIALGEPDETARQVAEAIGSPG